MPQSNVPTPRQKGADFLLGFLFALVVPNALLFLIVFWNIAMPAALLLVWTGMSIGAKLIVICAAMLVFPGLPAVFFWRRRKMLAVGMLSSVFFELLVVLTEVIVDVARS